jgi:hypothetical protein
VKIKLQTEPMRHLVNFLRDKFAIDSATIMLADSGPKLLGELGELANL